MAGWIKDLGVMRLGLLFLTAGVILASPEPGTAAVLDGRQVLSTLVAPALAPIVFMVLMLDALMGRVFLVGARGPARLHYRRIVAANLIAAIVLLLWWTPYFVRLFRA